MISHPPSFCGACLNFSREKDSAIPFPRRSRFFFFSFLVFLVFSREKSRLPGSISRPNVSEGYEVPLSYEGSEY